jgi:hypothetical protein
MPTYRQNVGDIHILKALGVSVTLNILLALDVTEKGKTIN